MKNILKINFFFYVLFLITIFTGNFKMFIILTLITIFHELGHIITGLIFNYNIEKIKVMPFGLITVFTKKINEKFYKDFLVTIMGPVFQFFLFLIIKDPKIIYLNKMLLLFNLLPIIPLDGSKILNLFLEKIFSYKTAYNLSFYISIAFIILFLKPNFTILLVLILYLFTNIGYIKDKKFYFNKFLLERYLYKFRFKKNNLIKDKDINKMKKFQKNIFISRKNIENEEEILSLMFDIH